MSAPQSEFSAFLLGLASNAMLHLGEMPHPESNACEVNLPLACHTIDLLTMLQEKTRGNLTTEEEQMLSRLLYDLRRKYVGRCNKP
ncbi:MAG: hypothetical protein ACI9WU_001640 [Myxococcota bacterium]|jgi:hypothetical protein